MRIVDCILSLLLVALSAFSQVPVTLRPEAKGAAGRVTLTPYLAAPEHNTGIAVVICPGGSYSWLDNKAEGPEAACWLQQNGVNAFVLHYRVASVAAYVTGFRVLGFGNRYPDMLTDAQEALRYVHRHSAEWGIDTTRIGVMGFSAGGHLAMMSGLYNHTSYRPRFICAVYPVVTMCDPVLTHKRSRRGALGVWGQWNKGMQDSLSIERHVTSDCPPVFLIHCQDDPVVCFQNSVMLDSTLMAVRVPHRYLLYRTGGHGFGASDTKGSAESRQWKKEFLQWILNLPQ